ncbi:MAG: hypothetical protein K9K66_07370 [Desulfarculaceae bacterium]|nr:hypothetical protein [Desulfarculaceae bacterium]MCF8071945.1 hypothetical protein [Desulfarculaceae bacterium]MCF8101462.1 hypothetical protein [Desulfarculaceae bacterium]MCF8115012.1 hypothetical protein [Desulfarculaceae bacterium]
MSRKKETGAANKNNNRHSISNILPYLSMAVAIVALIISVRSCSISEKQLLINESEYNSQRAILLTGSITNNQKTMILKPIDPNTKLIIAQLSFPSEVTDNPLSALPPALSFSLIPVIDGIARSVRDKIETKKGTYKIAQGFNLPVAIKSFYATKGDTYWDEAIYLIHFNLYIDSNANPSPGVHFVGLSPLGRIRNGEGLKNKINELWSQNLLTMMKKGKK